MAEQRLWAPWRLEYIRGEKDDGCFLCDAIEAGPEGDREHYLVHRGELCFVILNKFPYNSGHVMVAPNVHEPTIEELGAEQLAEMMELTKRSLAALRAVYRPDGFNIGINQGAVAGAGVEDHVHLHVVPRWGADTNFMPVIADTRVLPQALDESWSELSEAFAA
ncbi:MAG: HIT family protein [Thermoleophilaceae bacterium]